VLGRAPDHQPLVIDAAEEAQRRAARVGQAHRRQLVGARGWIGDARGGRVARRAIAGDRRRDVGRALQPALDLQAGDPGGDQGRHRRSRPARSCGDSR
jgi:hypothetical protein